MSILFAIRYHPVSDLNEWCKHSQWANPTQVTPPICKPSQTNLQPFSKFSIPPLKDLRNCDILHPDINLSYLSTVITAATKDMPLSLLLWTLNAQRRLTGSTSETSLYPRCNYYCHDTIVSAGKNGRRNGAEKSSSSA